MTSGLHTTRVTLSDRSPFKRRRKPAAVLTVPGGQTVTLCETVGETVESRDTASHGPGSDLYQSPRNKEGKLGIIPILIPATLQNPSESFRIVLCLIIFPEFSHFATWKHGAGAVHRTTSCHKAPAPLGHHRVRPILQTKGEKIESKCKKRRKLPCNVFCETMEIETVLGSKSIKLSSRTMCMILDLETSNPH